MTETKVSMQLTSYTLTSSNWQLWRREVIIGMKRINAYNLMTGAETRPSQPQAVPAATLDEAQANLAQASLNFSASEERSWAAPDDESAAASLRNAQAELIRATREYERQPRATTTTEAPTTNTETAEQEKRHDKTYHLLIMSLSETYKTLTIDCTDLPSTWRTLENHFESMAAADVIAAETQLDQLKLGENDDILEFLNTIRLIRNALAGAGAPISERKLFLTVIEKLPKKMQSIHDTVLYGSDERKTYAVLEQTLTSYAKNNPRTPAPEKANTVTNKPDVCKHCKRKGHTKAECRAKQHTCSKCGQSGYFEKRSKAKNNDRSVDHTAHRTRTQDTRRVNHSGQRRCD
jgi:hypothetical protein